MPGKTMNCRCSDGSLFVFARRCHRFALDKDLRKTMRAGWHTQSDIVSMFVAQFPMLDIRAAAEILG